MGILVPSARCQVPTLFADCAAESELSERARFYQEPVDRLRFKEGVRITYFEYLTALAMSYFERRGVNIVILETGLGGRLDATNAVETMVCGITSIGFDHMNLLGDTLTEIAGEKAGIIKAPTQRVVVAPQADEAMAVIQERCREFGILPTVVGKELALQVMSSGLDGVMFSVEGRRKYAGLTTGLLGEHQAVNAATAIAMAEDLEMYGFILTEEAVARGVREASWPARCELVRRDPAFIVDGAHTRESMAVLVAAVRALFPGRKATVIFGASEDKDIAGMAQELAPIAQRVIVTRADHPRSAVTAQLARHFSGVPVIEQPDVQSAVSSALAGADRDDIIVASGSLFVAAKARQVVLERQ